MQDVLLTMSTNILIQRLNEITFLTPLADIFAHFKQKLKKHFFFFFKQSTFMLEKIHFSEIRPNIVKTPSHDK